MMNIADRRRRRSPCNGSSKSALAILVAAFFALGCVVDAGSLRTKTATSIVHQQQQRQSPFLYAGNSFPVIEYMTRSETTRRGSNEHSSSDRGSGSSDGSADSGDVASELDEPSFLYSPNNPAYRLVQFYIKTGAASFSLRESFIRTAATVQDVARLRNVTIETYAVSCTAVPALCEVQGMSGLDTNGGTAFVLYKPSNTDGIRLEHLSASLVLEKMGLEATDEERTRLKLDAPVVISASDESHAMRTLDDLKNDIHLSFDIAMRHHVYNLDTDDLSLPLSQEKKAALKSWFLLIHKTLPPSWPIHNTVKELINSFMYVSKNEAYMLSILDSNKPATTDFSLACRKNGAATQVTHHTTDVTCGTWELFHAITVGVVEYNKLSQTERNTAHVAPEAAASILREYVLQFGMDGDDDSTSRHFLALSDSCLATHCLKPPRATSFWPFGFGTSNTTINSTSSVLDDWIRLPIWMSQVHTDINVKVQQEKTMLTGRRRATLQNHMDAAWPPHSYCPSCWNDAGKWNVEAVYNYLQLEYTQIDENIAPEVRNELFRMPLPRRFVEANINESDPYTLDLLQSSIILFAAAVLVLRILSVRSRILVTSKSD